MQKEPQLILNGPFSALRVSKVAMLTTFRRNGEGVETPIGIQFEGEKVYFTTPSTTGKVKRLQRDPRVYLAPFTKMGMKVIGPRIEGTARQLSEQEMQVRSDKKSSLWGRFWLWVYKQQGKTPIVYEIIARSV